MDASADDPALARDGPEPMAPLAQLVGDGRAQGALVAAVGGEAMIWAGLWPVAARRRAKQLLASLRSPLRASGGPARIMSRSNQGTTLDVIALGPAHVLMLLVPADWAGAAALEPWVAALGTQLHAPSLPGRAESDSNSAPV